MEQVTLAVGEIDNVGTGVLWESGERESSKMMSKM